MDADEALEEQEMELEALESIYMEDFELLSEPGEHPARLQLRLVPVQGGADREEGGNYVAVKLQCEYTTMYPSDLPKVTMVNEFGLSTSQIQELQKVAMDAAEEYVGDVMVYSMAEAITEWLKENNRPELDGSAHSEMMERARVAQEKEDSAKREEEERKAAALKAESNTEEGIRKRLGTMVTPDLFHAWNEKFLAEMEAIEKARQDDISKSFKSKQEGQDRGIPEEVIMARPTGKSLFEMDVTLINSEDKMIADALAEEEALIAAAAAAANHLASNESKSESGAVPLAPAAGVVDDMPIDASLFQGDEDDDLDDLDDLDLDDDDDE